MSDKPAPQPNQGKGSKTRVKDLKAYRENYDEIFKKKPLTEEKESTPIVEEDLNLRSCELCGENAWDGYICHGCGFKEI